MAVVDQVVDTRTIEIDHANWGGPGAVPGGISRAISVVDVSPANDWSAVRVALGHSGEFGSIYPTYGFIYNRPDRGTMVAANEARAPVPALNPAPRDLRSVAAREPSYDEVAEAPDDTGLVTRHGTHHRARRVAYFSRTGHRPVPPSSSRPCLTDHSNHSVMALGRRVATEGHARSTNKRVKTTASRRFLSRKGASYPPWPAPPPARPSGDGLDVT